MRDAVLAAGDADLVFALGATVPLDLAVAPGCRHRAAAHRPAARRRPGAIADYAKRYDN